MLKSFSLLATCYLFLKFSSFPVFSTSFGLEVFFYHAFPCSIFRKRKISFSYFLELIEPIPSLRMKKKKTGNLREQTNARLKRTIFYEISEAELQIQHLRTYKQQIKG